MPIKEAIASIDRLADRWVRLEEVQRVPKGLTLYFGVYKGKRGRQLDAWRIRCAGVHQAVISGLDGGGMALYPSTHPAARESVAQQAEVRWSGNSDEIVLLGALYKAHRFFRSG